MSQISTFERLSGASVETLAPQPAQPVSTVGAPGGFTLRRTGKRPLFFEGAELCMAMSFVVGTPFWYELNIYRTTAQSFVVYIRLFTKAEGEQDVFKAFECASFDEVMTLLETYDAAEDVRVDLPADEAEAPLADLVVRMLGLRARVEEARRQFRGLVGQVLYELDS